MQVRLGGATLKNTDLIRASCAVKTYSRQMKEVVALH